MAVYFKMNLSSLDEDKVIDSQFYDPKKLRLIESLKKGSYSIIRDEFDEITDL